MKITESELNRKIAELRDEVRYGQLQPGGSIVICEETKAIPSYSSDMNLAVELLRDLPFASLNVYATDVSVYWEAGGYRDRLCVDGLIGKEAETICRAWLQWRTGEVYEVIE